MKQNSVFTFKTLKKNKKKQKKKQLKTVYGLSFFVETKKLQNNGRRLLRRAPERRLSARGAPGDGEVGEVKLGVAFLVFFVGDF